MIDETKVAAFDVETYLFSASNRAPRLVCAGVSRSSGEGEFYHRDNFLGQLEDLLQPGTILANHFIAYDMAVVCAIWPALIPTVFRAYQEDRVFCTKLLAEMVDYAQHGEARRKSYSLGKLFPELDKDTHRMHYGEYDQLPVSLWPDGAEDYAIMDAVVARELFLTNIAAYTRAGGGETVVASHTYADFCLHLATTWGCRVCAHGVRTIRDARAPVLDAAIATLKEAGFLTEGKDGKLKLAEKNIRDYAAGLEVAEGIVFEKTEKGQISASYKTGNQDLTEDPVFKAWVAYKSAAPMTTFLDKFDHALREGRLHPPYKPVKVTGRAGAGGKDEGSTMGGLNIQNIPNATGFRECLIPSRDGVLIFADLPSIECRGLAQTCKNMIGYSELGDALNEGTDVHLLAGAMFFGWTLEEAIKRFEAKDPQAKLARKLGKPWNFGRGGGMGERTFVQAATRAPYNAPVELTRLSPVPFEGSVEFDLQDALDTDHYSVFLEAVEGAVPAWYVDKRGEARVKVVDLIAKWGRKVYTNELGFLRLDTIYLQKFTCVQAYLKTCGDALRGKGTIDVRLDDGWKIANRHFSQYCNIGFQGRIAQAAKQGLIAVTEACWLAEKGSLLFGCRVVFFIHDEIGIDAPADKWQACADELERVFRDGVNSVISDYPVTANEPHSNRAIKSTAMLRWTKAAENAYYPGGKRAIWELLQAQLKPTTELLAFLRHTRLDRGPEVWKLLAASAPQPISLAS